MDGWASTSLGWEEGALGGQATGGKGGWGGPAGEVRFALVAWWTVDEEGRRTRMKK
jgi:hypothetical protein